MPRTISFTSGKGGVGKTNVSFNMGLLLAANNKKVLLLDADFGLPNADIIASLRPSKNILEFFKGKCSITEVVCRYHNYSNYHILAGSSGTKELANLSHEQLYRLLEAIGRLIPHYDYFIVDTSAGIQHSVLLINASCDIIVVMIAPYAASIVDSYALMKAMHASFGINKFKLAFNMCEEKKAKELFSTFNNVSKKQSQIDFVFDYLGYIPEDINVTKAISQRIPFLQYNNKSAASINLAKIAQKLFDGITTVPPNKIGFWDRFKNNSYKFH